MEDFGPAAVGLVEDLLVNFPSRLGDVHPPFAEFGVLQVVVHFIFLPRRCCSRSVTCFHTGTEPPSPAQHVIARHMRAPPVSGAVFGDKGDSVPGPPCRSLCMLSTRPGLSEQFLRHRLLQSLPDPSRRNHGELPETLFGNSELASLLQNPAHFPKEMPVVAIRSATCLRPCVSFVFSLLVHAQPSAPAAGVGYAFDVASSTIGWLGTSGVFSMPMLGLCWCERPRGKRRKNLSRPGCGLLP